MSPDGFEKLAGRLFNLRWWLAGASALNFLLLVAAFVLPAQPPSFMFAALLGPMVLLPWAFFCVVAWFHPKVGNLQADAKLFRRLSGPVQSVVRWYGAILLSLFVLVAVVVWPALVLNWM